MKHLYRLLLATSFFAAILIACGTPEGANLSQTAQWQTQDQQRGVNLTAYCQRKFGGTFKAVLHGHTTGDWSCQTDDNNRRPISVVEACQQQQNTSRVGVRDVNDPLSWYCLVSTQVWVPVRVGVNLTAYCQRKFGNTFKAVVHGHTTGDWSCQTDDNNRRPISVVEACQQQQGTSKVGYTNVNDPLSWYCEK